MPECGCRVLDRPVAIKLLAARVSDDEHAKRRFLREARTAAALEHPNIAPVYDAGETEEGDAYLAMPLYEGRTLNERLAERPLPPEEAVRITLALADSLEYAHSQGVRVSGVYPGPVDTDMVRDVPMEKTSPSEVAHRIIDGIEADSVEAHLDANVRP